MHSGMHREGRSQDASAHTETQISSEVLFRPFVLGPYPVWRLCSSFPQGLLYCVPVSQRDLRRLFIAHTSHTPIGT